MIHIYGVEVEVVDAWVVILRRRDVGFIEANVIDALPFEDDLFGLDV